jgi:hypothetical protein
MSRLPKRAAPASRQPSPAEDESLEALVDLATMLDSRWRIPGTGLRFGVDAVAGLVPGFGDVAAGIVSAFVIYKAAQMGAPGHVIARMVGNVALDTVVGSVPLLGSVFDVFFKANNRNVAMLKRHLESRARR